MNQEKYNLKWRTYSDHLRKMLHEMMKSNELTDVTLVCDDNTQFKAHKIVLSACSLVFKSIINNLSQNCSVIYLRGIQHQEMESILEFMYLGVATFYQERMNEFLDAAKNLEIKEISNNVEFDEKFVEGNEPELDDNISDTKLANELPHRADNYSINRQMGTDCNDSQIHKQGPFDCGKCDRQFKYKSQLTLHMESKHEGVKYPCNQCEYLASRQSCLKRHIMSIHKGVKFACNQCEFQSKRQDCLKTHIQSKHEGVKQGCLFGK